MGSGKSPYNPLSSAKDFVSRQVNQMTTQLLFPSSFRLALTGSTTLTISGLDHVLTWTTTLGFQNQFSISGSSVGGSYLYANAASQTQATYQGGGGGVLAGYSPLLYVSLSGSLEVTVFDNGISIGSSTLDVSLLLQITGCHNASVLSLASGYGNLPIDIESTIYILNLVGNTKLIITEGANTILMNPGVRVMTIGDFLLTASL
jgi:hypothetical protein